MCTYDQCVCVCVCVCIVPVDSWLLLLDLTPYFYSSGTVCPAPPMPLLYNTPQKRAWKDLDKHRRKDALTRAGLYNALYNTPLYNTPYNTPQKLAWKDLDTHRGKDALSFVKNFEIHKADYEELARLHDLFQAGLFCIYRASFPIY